MSAGAKYLVALGTASAAAFGVGCLLTARARAGVWLATGAALGVQGPLGWWALRSLGTDRFIVAWGLGIATRFLLLVVMAILVLPSLALPAAPPLIVMAALLIVMVFVEGFVAMSASGLRQPR